MFLRFEEFRVFLIEKVLYLSLDRLCVFVLIFVQGLLLFVTVSFNAFNRLILIRLSVIFTYEGLSRN